MEADEARPDCEATLTKINAFLEDAFQSSCEGIMVKSLDVDAGYFASKRADSWLKVLSGLSHLLHHSLLMNMDSKSVSSVLTVNFPLSGKARLYGRCRGLP